MSAWFDALRYDVRAAFRGLRSAPVIALCAVGCMALGIGATATIYSTANAFTFRPLPQLGAPERLVVLSEATDPDNYYGAVSALTYTRLRDASRALVGVAIAQFGSASIRGVEEPERVTSVRANAAFFDVLGVRLPLGRGFGAEDERGGSRSVVISHGLWQRQLGGDPAAIGRSLVINGEPHTVIGVAQEGFGFPNGTEVWQPITLDASSELLPDRRWYMALARLEDGQRLEALRAELAGVQAGLAREHPAAWDGWRLNAERAEKVFGSGARPFMLSMLVGVAFVLLIACGNVAMLLLARSAARQRELAIRLALGAGRAALVRQCLTESVLLGLVGGALGILLSLWGIDLVVATIPPELQNIIVGYGALRIDARAVLVAVAVSVASGLLFGLAPAIDAARMPLREWLTAAGADSASGRRSERLRHGMIVTEVALASALLVSALLMLQSVLRLGHTDPGFAPARILTFRVTAPQQGYDSPERLVQFHERLEERLRALPQVERVGLVNIIPMSWNNYGQSILREGEPLRRPADARYLQTRIISADYFDALGLRPVRGRDFTAVTATSPAVVLVSVSAARRIFGEDDPIGRRIRVGESRDWLEVIGLVPDVRHNPLQTDAPEAAVYVPLVQRPPRSMSFMLRTRTTDPTAVAPAARAAVAAQDPRIAAGEIFSMQRVIDSATSPHRGTAGALFIFGIIAVVLAACGIYGVISYFVTLRGRELAIRVVLGARARVLLADVLHRALRLALLGIVLGLTGALAMARGLQAILFETNAVDPLTYAGVGLTIGLVALLATLLPAVRAARAEPAAVLRGAG